MKNLIATLLFFMSFTFVVKAQDKQPDEVIKAKVVETGLKYSITSDGTIKFILGTNNGRSQVVKIAGSIREKASGNYMELWSTGFKLSTNVPDINKVMMEILKRNAKYNILAWQLHEADGYYYFVLSAKILVTASSVALYRELEALAAEADDFEVKYVQGDEF